MNRHIPRIMGQGIQDLKMIANPRKERGLGDMMKEPVIISAPMAQAIAPAVKSHARDHMKINLPGFKRACMLFIRLQDAIAVLHKSGLKIPDLARQECFGFRKNLGNDQAFSHFQSRSGQAKGVRLPEKGKISHDSLCAVEFGERKQAHYNYVIISGAFLWIKQTKAFPTDFPQHLLVMSYGFQ